MCMLAKTSCELDFFAFFTLIVEHTNSNALKAESALCAANTWGAVHLLQVTTKMSWQSMFLRRLTDRVFFFFFTLKVVLPLLSQLSSTAKNFIYRQMISSDCACC